MDIYGFYEYVNKDYLNRTIPPDQSAINNFDDITKDNTNKLIKLMKGTSTDIDESFVRQLYARYILYLNNKCTHNEIRTNCAIIHNIIRNAHSHTKLFDKIMYLSQFNIHIFMTYGLMQDPYDSEKFKISIRQRKLSYDKEYYSNKKYTEDIKQLHIYRENLLSFFQQSYNNCFNMSDQKIKEIMTDVIAFENMIYPYITSNIYKRDIKARINQYTIESLCNKFKHIDFSSDTFLSNYNIPDKTKLVIIFSDDLAKCNFNAANVVYSELTDDEKSKYDNGEYYWLFIDNLFKQYHNNSGSIRRIIDNYITFLTINSLGHFVSYDVCKIGIDFYEKYLHGIKKELPADEKAITYVIGNVPELVGELFCKVHFPDSHKNYMSMMVKYMLNSFEDLLKYKCDWIKDKNKGTLEHALLKINKLRLIDHQKIGRPNKNTYKYKYDILYNILGDNVISSMSILNLHLLFIEWEAELNKVLFNKGQYDINTWSICPASTNAYYNPLQNEMVFPAGILQVPFFIYLKDDNKILIQPEHNLDDRIRMANDSIEYDSLRYITIASNFGSIGVIIGHEISHGFDDQGSNFDANGTYRKWMSDEVIIKYKQIKDKMIAQFNKYELTLVDKYINVYNVSGELTLGENMADLFGISIALQAYKIYYEEKLKGQTTNKTLNEGLLEFFCSFANMWRNKELVKKIKYKLTKDVHAPPIYRVIGTLTNVHDFDQFIKDPSNDKIRLFDK
jgi:putative endopeptidase